MSEYSLSNTAPKTLDVGGATKDLLAKLSEAQTTLEKTDPQLADRLLSLKSRGKQSDQLERPDFQQRVAYVFEDVEKSRFGRIEVPSGYREELTRLAGSAPGLENERMTALLRSTATIDNRQLIVDIRKAATDIGRRADQDSPDLVSQIETLENRARLAAKVPASAAAPAQTAAPAQPEAQATAHASAQATAPHLGAHLAGTEPAAARDNAARFNQQAAAGGPRTAANPTSGQVVAQFSTLDTILRALRPEQSTTSPPWLPSATSMAERFAAFDQKIQGAGDERVFQCAERAGRMALDAIQSFNANEGAAVMGKINAAAQSDPGGLAAVMADMRDGGRYADLRKQFNGALQTERGAATYDRAQSALATYEQDRVAAQNVAANRPDAAALSARFEDMDAKVGRAATAIPSRDDGRSMVEDLAKHVTEMLTRAAQAVRNALGRSPSPDAGSRPSPSPAPSPG